MERTQFQNNLARAQQLMLDDNFNRLVESKTGGAKRMNSGGGGDLAALEAQAFGYSSSQQNSYEPIQQVRQPQRESKLPQSILESFRDTPPMSGEMDNGLGSLMEGMYQQQMPQQNYRPQPQQQYNAGGIDYSLIKTIVEECIRNSQAGMLNEGMVKGFRVGSDKTVQFVDMKGNLYEGVLKLKKKAKQ